MNKKEKRIAVRQAAEKAVIRDGQASPHSVCGNTSYTGNVRISEHNTLWTGTGKSRGKPFRIWFQ